MKKEVKPDLQSQLERLLREKAELETEMEPNLVRYTKITELLKTKYKALKEAERTEVLNKYGVSEDSVFHCKLIEGSNMVCEDEDGLADCYVSIAFEDFSDKTPVVKNSNAPQWNVEYKWDVEKAGDIKLQCWDYNKKRPHTLIGEATLTTDLFQDQRDHEFWIKFYLGENTTGKLHVRAGWIWSRVKLFKDEIARIERELNKVNPKIQPQFEQMSDIDEQIRILRLQLEPAVKEPSENECIEVETTE